MRNIFKLLIPKDKAQTVTVLQSWTVQWEVLEGWGDDVDIYHKSFVDKKDAQEFEKQLNESAAFINAYISTKLYEN
jgi:hypothetical protein